MINIAPVGYIDCWPAIACLYRHREAFATGTTGQDVPGSPHHSTQSIILRGPENPTPENWYDDVPQIDYPILEMKEWKPIANLLLRIRRQLHQSFPNKHPAGEPIEFGKVMIVSLKPSCHVDWHEDVGRYYEAHARFHLPLVTNPNAVLYSGQEALAAPGGMLCWLNNRRLHSAVNLGTTPRIHMIVDVRQPI